MPREFFQHTSDENLTEVNIVKEKKIWALIILATAVLIKLTPATSTAAMTKHLHAMPSFYLVNGSENVMMTHCLNAVFSNCITATAHTGVNLLSISPIVSVSVGFSYSVFLPSLQTCILLVRAALLMALRNV